jgi:hypothetical protein
MRNIMPAFVLALALAGCGPPEQVDAPPPTTVSGEAASPDSAPPVPPTYASAPVRLDLRILLREIEQTIPNHIGSLDDRLLILNSPRTWVAIEVMRGPLEIDLRSSSLTLTATVAYRGKVWRKVPLTTVSASCGTGEKAPLARIKIRSDYRVMPNWRIRTRSQVLSVERATDDPADNCKVTFLGINVTDKVLAAAKAAIAQQLRVADARLASVDVRGALAPVWADMQEPISLQDTTIWLSLRPKAVGVSRVTVRDSIAHGTVTLLAEPRIVAGIRPPADTLPLPNLSDLEASDTLAAVLDGSLSYAAANEILRTEMKGKKLRIRGRRVVVEDVSMSYIGQSRVALGVKLSGAVSGRVFFIGTPTYDAAKDAITVPDLTYDLRTSNLLLQGVSWLAGNKLRDELRRTAVLPVHSMLDLARGLANQEITRDLADGVRLSGAVGSAQALTARATADGFRAQARATGKLALQIHLARVFKDVHIPKQPIKGIEPDTADTDAIPVATK